MKDEHTRDMQKEMRNYILEDFGVFNRSVKPSNEI